MRLSFHYLSQLPAPSRDEIFLNSILISAQLHSIEIARRLSENFTVTCFCFSLFKRAKRIAISDV